jgi:hypothetical protein
MGLINLLTDPKNFKFYNGGQGYTGNGNQPGLTNIPYGKDRIDGGSSGQPYIQIPIPDDISNLGSANKDFILRGGTLAVSNSATDALRLTKMFGDLKSPSGLLFTAKQQLLSRTAVRTQASGKELNEGIYNPLTTIAQAAAVAFGTHLNKQSLIIPYSEVVKNNQQPGNNRLVLLYSGSFIENKDYDLNGIKLNNGVNVMTYSGGPNSTLGIGKTNIRYFDQRTGINNPLATANSSYFTGNKIDFLPLFPGSIPNDTPVFLHDRRDIPNYIESKISSSIPSNAVSKGIGIRNPLAKTNSLYFTGNNPTGSILNYTPVFLHSRTDIEEKKYTKTLSLIGNQNKNKGVSGVYSKLTNNQINNFFNVFGTQINTNNHNVYTQGTTFPENSSLINNNGTYVYNQDDIITSSPIKGTYNTTQDFRAVLRGKLEQKLAGSQQTAINAGQLTAAPSYNIGDKQTIETRVNLGDPGNRANKNYSSYAVGISSYGVQDTNLLGSKNQGGNNGNDASTSEAQLGLDKINSLPIYKSEGVDTTGITNDLCKFRIAVIDNNAPIYKTFVHFRAFLDSINDSYTADWNATKYLGRGESFYNYNGFTRQISLSWTVAAQSKQELIPMYKKLNYLASSLTPEYSLNGYMRGNMVQLTIGGYLYEQPGIITGLTYNIEENTPWEIGIDTSYESGAGTVQGDSSVKELPHILRVTGFNFIPIHRFRPELQSNLNDYKHYIALANGEGAQNNNYGSAIPDVADTIFQATDPPVNDLRGTGVIAPLLRSEQQPGFIGPLRPSPFEQFFNNLNNLGR